MRPCLHCEGTGTDNKQPCTPCNGFGAVQDGDYSIGSRVWPGTSKLLEEMGELQQVLGKLLGAGQTKHWDGSDLRQRLIEEIADVQAALSFFVNHNLNAVEASEISGRELLKVAQFEKWHLDCQQHHLQKECSIIHGSRTEPKKAGNLGPNER